MTEVSCSGQTKRGSRPSGEQEHAPLACNPSHARRPRCCGVPCGSRTPRAAVLWMCLQRCAPSWMCLQQCAPSSMPSMLSHYLGGTIKTPGSNRRLNTGIRSKTTWKKSLTLGHDSRSSYPYLFSTWLYNHVVGTLWALYNHMWASCSPGLRTSMPSKCASFGTAPVIPLPVKMTANSSDGAPTHSPTISRASSNSRFVIPPQ